MAARRQGFARTAAGRALALALAGGLLSLPAAGLSAGTLEGTGLPAGSPGPRIVGGTEVDPPGKYPFVAAIVRRGEDSYHGQYCGGSVIGPEWVLTAAHCLEDESAASVDVVVGRHDLGTSAGERIRARRLFIYPGYDPGSFAGDLALIRLASPTSYAPVWLPADASLEAPGTMLRVAGWGDTSGGSWHNYPYELREAELPVVSDAACLAAYAGYDNPPAALMLCAGYLGLGGVDSCQGDSGGPLFAATGEGFTLVGIVSSGEGCGLPDFPGMYTSVAAFTGWIANRTGITPPGLPPLAAECLGAAATILGTDAAETINGTDGDDVIVGLGGNDTIYGQGGADRICGGGGDDRLIGGPGSDFLDGGAGIDTATGGLGTDTCYGETRHGCELPAAEAPLCFGLPATMVGTEAAETLNGTEGPDVIVALGGNDTVDGRGGADRICGGLGDDAIDAGSGNDRVRGGGGRDTVLGGAGADVLRGGAGADDARGGDGEDRLYGDAGDDYLDGEAGVDAVDGGTETDTCYGEMLSACELPGGSLDFGSGPLHLPVSDATDTVHVITVAGGGSIGDLDVGLRITHTWVGDLRVTLTHVETGTTVVLIDRPGAPALGTFGCGRDDIDATLDDEAAVAAEDQCRATRPAILGPVRPGRPLSAFDGESIGGRWRLTVSDRAALDQGFLEEWSLRFSG